MKRTFALTAAFGLTATIVFLPGGAGAADDSAPAAPGAEPLAPAPVPAMVTGPSGAAPQPAPAAVPAEPAAPAIPAALAIPAAPTALPAPVPAPVAAVVTPPAPASGDHMAELCAAREVFCHVDSSGRYTGS